MLPVFETLETIACSQCSYFVYCLLLCHLSVLYRNLHKQLGNQLIFNCKEIDIGKNFLNTLIGCNYTQTVVVIFVDCYNREYLSVISSIIDLYYQCALFDQFVCTHMHSVIDLIPIIQEASLLLSAQDYPYSQELYQNVIKVNRFLRTYASMVY